MAALQNGNRGKKLFPGLSSDDLLRNLERIYKAEHLQEPFFVPFSQSFNAALPPNFPKYKAFLAMKFRTNSLKGNGLK